MKICQEISAHIYVHFSTLTINIHGHQYGYSKYSIELCTWL